MNILWQRFKIWWIDSYIYLVFFWRTKHGTSTWKKVVIIFLWTGIIFCSVAVFDSITEFIYPIQHLEQMEKNTGVVQSVNFPQGKFSYDNITLLADDGKQINYRYSGRVEDKQLVGQKVTVWSQYKWIVFQFKNELKELQKDSGEFLKNYTYEKASAFREREKTWAKNFAKTGIFFLFLIWLLNRKGPSKPKIIQSTGDEK